MSDYNTHDKYREEYKKMGFKIICGICGLSHERAEFAAATVCTDALLEKLANVSGAFNLLQTEVIRICGDDPDDGTALGSVVALKARLETAILRERAELGQAKLRERAALEQASRARQSVAELTERLQAADSNLSAMTDRAGNEFERAEAAEAELKKYRAVAQSEQTSVLDGWIARATAAEARAKEAEKLLQHANNGENKALDRFMAAEARAAEYQRLERAAFLAGAEAMLRDVLAHIPQGAGRELIAGLPLPEMEP